MKILAIDTSTRYLSVAVMDGESLLARFRDKGETQHASLLIPAIDGVLKKCRLKLKEIDAIALSIGPGSFTGLRVGVATAKGINLGLGTPIVAVPTLDAITYNFADEEEGVLCPLLDAKKQKVYACFYRKVTLKRMTGYMLTDVESVLKMVKEPTVVFGDAVLLYGEHCRRNALIRVSKKEWLPAAEVVAKLGLEKARKKEFADPDKLVPMYLHSKYCQVKK
jgi:tRNA threonylcarbamoyl adenosine modification protein YeaZ